MLEIRTLKNTSTNAGTKGGVFGKKVEVFLEILPLTCSIFSTAGALVAITVLGLSPSPFQSTPTFCSKLHQPIPVTF